MGLDQDLAEYNRAIKEGRIPSTAQIQAYQTIKNRPITQEDRINQIYETAKKEGWKGSRINQAINEIKFKAVGGTQAAWEQLVAEDQRNINTSRQQSAGLKAAGNAEIQASIAQEAQRLNNFTATSPNISTSSKVTALNPTGQKTFLNPSGKVSEAKLAQALPIGSTYETRSLGFIPSKDKVGTKKSILTEAQQSIKAQQAFGSNLYPGLSDYEGSAEKNLPKPYNTESLIIKTLGGLGVSSSPLVSKYLKPKQSILDDPFGGKQNYAYTVDLGDVKSLDYQGPPKPFFVVDLNGKERKFKTEKSALEFQKRTQKEFPDFFVGPKGQLSFTGKFNLQDVTQSSFLSDILNRFGERSDILLDTKNDPLSKILVPSGAVAVSIGSSIFNLASQAGSFFEKQFTGKETKPEQVKVPKTVGGEYLGSLGEGVIKSIETGNFAEIQKGSEEGKKKVSTYYEKYGPIAFVSSVAAETVGVPFKTLSPLKVSSGLIPVEKGVQSIGTRISIGYGKLSTPIISRIDSKIRFGSGEITRETVKNLYPGGALEIQTGRGVSALELATSKDITQSLLTSTSGLKSLVEAKKILPSDVSFINAQKRLAELAGLAQKKLSPEELKQVEVLPRGIFEGLETVKEEETFVKEIIPKIRPTKGSQTMFTQIREGLRPLGLVKSDTDVDYIGGLLGDRFATNRAIEIAKNTVSELNDIMGSQRAAVRSGSKVFTGKIIEGVVFPGSKGKLTREQLKNRGEKLAEFLTKKDTDTGSNSVINDVSKIFGIKKSTKIVKIPTGYTGILGKKYRKEVTLPTQLLNQIASATRIQSKESEVAFKGSKIPFLKPEYKDLLRTETGFRVGSDIQRLKDIARQQPVALQLAESLEKKGYIGKVAEVKGIFEIIKKAKPEIDFDAAFQSIEKIGESENIPSVASYIGSSARKNTIPTLSLTKNILSVQPKQNNNIPSPKSVATNSIVSNSIVKTSRLASLTGSTSSKSVSRLSGKSSSLTSIASRTASSIQSLSKPNLKSSIFKSITAKSRSSVISQSTRSPPSVVSTSSKSPGSISSPLKGKSVIGKSTIRSSLRLLQPTQPISGTSKTLRGGLLLLKFNQVKFPHLPKQSKKKFFIASEADPLRAGVAFTAGVKELRSSQSKIFKQIDRDLIRARKGKNTLDPLTGYKKPYLGPKIFGKKGLLSSYSKIKI